MTTPASEAAVTTPPAMAAPIAVSRRPVSPRRLAANRANAKRSTGPRTAQGKHNSSLNAQKTGMHGSLHPVRGGVFREDPLEVEALLDDVLASLDPRDQLEQRLAVQIATLLQREVRADKVEAVHYSAIGRLDDDTLDTEEICDAEFNSLLYTQAAELLGRDPETYSPADVADLALAQTKFDPILARMYPYQDFSHHPDFDKVRDRILRSLTNVHATLEQARQQFLEIAQTEAAKVPDADEELAIAERAVRVAMRDGTIEATSRIHARNSLDLDRQLTRYSKLRKRTLRDEPAIDDASPDDGAGETIVNPA